MGAISYRARVLSNESERWVRHTHEVLENLQDLQVVMETFKSSYLEFALTGDESALRSLRNNKLSAMQHVTAIRDLTVDNASQQRRIADIEGLTLQKIQFGEMVVDLRRMKGPGAAADVIAGTQGQRITDEFGARVREAQAEEQRLLRLRGTDAARRLGRTKTNLIAGTILGLLIVMAAGWNVHRESVRHTLTAQLLDSKEAIAALLELTHDAIFVRNLKNEIIFWNKSAEDLYGWRKKEVEGRTTHELLHTVFPAPLEDIDAEVLRKGYWGGELTHQRKDGSSLSVSSRWAVQMDGSGRPVAILESNRDVSQRQQVDRRFRGLMEAAPDAMVVVNQNGEIVLLNLQAERKFGYSRDELVGRKVTSIIPKGFAERLIADGTRTAAEGLMQQIGTGIELSGRRKDGSEFPIEIMLSPLENAEGILVTAAIRDISVRKAAEEHLVQMEGRYRGLLEAAPDAMVVVNQNGEIVLLNVQAERKFGYSRDELVGQKVKSILPEGFEERLVTDGTRSAAEALAQQIGTGIELSARRKDGSEFPIEIMLSPLENAEGILITAAIRDISVRKAAEEHLVQMEGRYRGLLEAAPDAMVVVNQSGEIVLLNVQAERKFGYSRDELVGQKVTSIIPQGFAERLIADGTRTDTEALLQQIGTGIELSGRCKDGSEFPIEIMLSPLENAEGILVTAAIRDISVRKAAAEHLVQMEGRYRGLLEAAPDAMVVVNQSGEIVLLNLQAERKFGYSRDELVGRKVTSIIPQGFAERLIADGTRTDTEALLQQIGTGIELSGRRKDGSEFPIEIMLSPLENAEGFLVTAAIRDISVRKVAQENLRQTEERLSLIVTNVVDYAILVLDLDGRFVNWNEGAERIKGYRAEEMIGRHFSCFYPAEDVRNGVPAQNLAEATRNGRSEAEGWRVRKDGSQFYANVVITALRDKTGQLRGYGKITRDITERVRTEERRAKSAGELKRSNDQLEQFAYVASHDLQEPLRMVASYTQLLAKRYKGRLDSDADEFIAYAVDGCNRMQSLIRDLLAYSRSGAERKALREISGNTALKEALVNLRVSIEDSGAMVTHDLLPAITTDGTQLVQIFQNLIGNAIKYHGTALPLVHVAATKNGDKEWIFSVQDNGLGIAPQYFERIFTIFQRLHGKHEFAGTGIGLAICKKSVEQLGGRIWVESEVEKGSTFYFALPVNGGR
jgi:PAS domain S-box-containing protein